MSLTWGCLPFCVFPLYFWFIFSPYLLREILFSYVEGVFETSLSPKWVLTRSSSSKMSSELKMCEILALDFFFSEISASSELSSELIFELMRRDRPAGRSASGLGQKVDLFWTPSILCVRQLFRSSFGTSVSPVRWEHEYPVRGCHRSILFQWMTY